MIRKLFASGELTLNALGDEKGEGPSGYWGRPSPSLPRPWRSTERMGKTKLRRAELGSGDTGEVEAVGKVAVGSVECVERGGRTGGWEAAFCGMSAVWNTCDESVLDTRLGVLGGRLNSVVDEKGGGGCGADAMTPADGL